MYSKRQVDSRQVQVQFHCYGTSRPTSDCDETLTVRLRQSVRELRRRSDTVSDKLERKYAGRVRVEMVRRQVEHETDAEVREAIAEMETGR